MSVLSTPPRNLGRNAYIPADDIACRGQDQKVSYGDSRGMRLDASFWDELLNLRDTTQNGHMYGGSNRSIHERFYGLTTLLFWEGP